MPELPHNAKDIFLAALDRAEPADRAIFVTQACSGDDTLRRHVEALLSAHDEPDRLLDQSRIEHDVPLARSACSAAIAQSLAEQPGTMIGPYKLLEVLGEGGMGVVYLAEQSAPVERRVALKIIKPGMDSRQVIARFEAERQALAMMDHVNIARVLDVGTTQSGQPFFVMELVHGVPITQYCDDQRLTPRQRLELFVPVCQAIQHAHQKGIIHRDIKPSNVMIALYDGRPVPKVIDFGVAKATDQRLTERTLFTQHGTLVGTLEYMSPEQADPSGLGVDTRSDIFSLGVLLYELLTGGTPLSLPRIRAAAYGEVLRLIKEEEPQRPSVRLSDSGEALASISAQRQMEPARLTKLVRGELDWIVMKCLEKDRNCRYETANVFAMDLQRYLNDEAVQACPPSVAYRLRKFVRRNKRHLATVALLCVMLVVALGAVAGSAGWVVRDHAARQARLADDVRLDLERTELLQAQGKRVEALAAFERAEQAAGAIALEPALRQRLTALKERLDAEARDLDFVARFEEVRLLDQSQVNEQEGRFALEAALPKITEQLRECGITVGVTAPAQAAAWIQGRPEAIQGCLEAALHVCLTSTQAKDASTRQWLIAVLNGVDSNPWRTQVRKAWVSADRQAFEELTRALEEEKQPASFLLWVADQVPSTAGSSRLHLLRRIQRAYPADFWANHDLARALATGGHPAEAARYYTAALALRPRNPGVYVNRGLTLQKAGELEAAIADFRQALAIAPNYINAYCNLASALKANGDVEAAITLYRQALALNPKYAAAHYSLGNALREKRQLEGAIAAYKEAIHLQPEYAEAHVNLGGVLTAMRQWDAAIVEYKEAIRIQPKLAVAHYNLGNCYRRMGQLGEASVAYTEAIRVRPEYAEAHNNLASTLETQGQWGPAIAAYEEAIRLLPNDADPHNNLAWLLATCREPEFRNGGRAVVLGQRAVQLKPQAANFWNTLGVAHYRASEWKAAITVLEKSVALRGGGDSVDWLFLAMAHWQLGENDEAHKWYNRAAHWLETNKPESEEQKRFRAEAEELLKKQPGVGGETNA